jgi:hypothetical protein
MPNVMPSVGDHRVIRSSERLRDEFKNRYWDDVERALREVFGADEALANKLREKLSAAPPEMQAVFYDAGPFAVAADLVRGLYLAT